MAKTTKTPYSLLGILSIAPSTGYDIKKFIEASICNFWSESFGQIYPMLSKLVKDGYATKNTQNQKGKPKKIIYRITNKGLETLQAWLREPAICMPHPRNEFLLKIFFGRHLTLKENISHIELLLQFVSERVRELDTKEKFLKKECADYPDLPFWLITISFGQESLRSIQNWCKKSIATLKKLEN